MTDPSFQLMPKIRFMPALADGVDGGQPGGDGQPVGGHHEGDAHKDDGNNQPDQRVAVVRAEHGGGGHGAGTDHDTGGHQAGTDAFQQIFYGESLHVRTKLHLVFVHDGSSFFIKGGALLYAAPRFPAAGPERPCYQRYCAMSTAGSWLRSRPRATQSFSSWFRGRTGLRIKALAKMPR